MDSSRDSESVSESDGDTFDDAPEVTPRPSSSHSRARSLMDKSRSSSQASRRTTEETPTDPTSDAKSDISGQSVTAVEVEKTSTSVSPPLTSKRISLSSLDDVNLEDGAQKSAEDENMTSIGSPVPTQSNRSSAASLPQTTTTPHQSDNASSAKASSPARPSMLPPLVPPSRKLTSPFSWLSRNTSSEKKPSASPPPSRFKTQRDSSVLESRRSSNTDLLVKKMEALEEDDGSGQTPSNRTSLRDQFKLLRMREESGMASLDNEDISEQPPASGGALAGLIGRSASIGFGVGSPTSIATEDKSEGSAPNSRRGTMSSTTTQAIRRSTIDVNLAPGTAAGMVSGPAEESATAVDWDLWQTVVYEGPQAVVKKSPEELNRAIVGGIPQVIRGVVWQVLAQSKNTDLEEVYRELVSQGLGKRLSDSTSTSSAVNGKLPTPVKDAETTTSSASSIHSNHSASATATSVDTNQHFDTSDQPRKTSVADVQRRLQAELGFAQYDAAKETPASTEKLEKVIKRDLGARTSYSKYLMAAGLQDGLFGLCKAYALFDTQVGYAQGINFIAMPLLFNMAEEEAFCLLVRLMSHYGLRDLFVQDMPGLHMHLYQFERLLEDFEPALHSHLSRRNVNPQLYATQWFLTLFAYRFPLQLVLRIYDLILSEGLEAAILKFGIVLMQRNSEALLAMQDMSALTTFLKERLFDVYIDKSPSASSLLESGFFGSSSGVDKEVYRADVLVQDACAVKLKPETLRRYADEWREKQRVEKEREAELDHLRQQSSTLTVKVRSLEERAEKSDQEHVNIASELVRTKVDNETLKDENESLLGQVEELKKIVEGQTEEVEKRLRGEMDAVLQKNIEVHNANRSLEEQLAEMEKELVETKLRYAQINGEYEDIKQRWNSVSAMLQGR